MATDSLVDTVKDKVELVKAHAPDVVKTGVETLRAAQGVVTEARDKLKQTLKEGAEKIGHQVAHLATMTHKEQAEAKKAEVKAKKRAKRARATARARSQNPDDAAQSAA